MVSSTKEAFAAALKQVMAVKPINKITVKDLVEICGVNRQTFYYHFDDVYDLLEWVFEEDAKRVLPREIKYEQWQRDVIAFFEYLYENKVFALNVFNSSSRSYMLRFLKQRLQECIRGFAEIVSEGWNIDRQDFEFVVEFYSHGVIGLLSEWMDMGMKLPPCATKERFMKMLVDSMENMLGRFRSEN